MLEPIAEICVDLEGAQGPGPPLKNHKNIEFLSNTGPEPLLMLGHHWPASETPLKWRLAGGPMMALSLWYLDPHQLKKNKKKRCLRWTPSDKLFWISACKRYIECWLGIFVIFRGSEPVLLRNPIERGSRPLPSSGSTYDVFYLL